ncbi:MAG: hypothetical protein ACRYFK_11540 [Janthinobacterium lividum]
MPHGLLRALLFALLLPLAGRGQARPASPAAAHDSMAAIKRLFRQRRLGSELGWAVGCGTVTPATSTTATEASQLLLPPGAVAGLGTNCSLVSFFGSLRFSHRREQQVLRCLARHQPLPGYVQRALSPVLASN